MENTSNLNLGTIFARLFEQTDRLSDVSRRSQTDSQSGNGSATTKLSPFETKAISHQLRSIEGSLKRLVQSLEKTSSLDRSPAPAENDSTPPPSDDAPPAAQDNSPPPANSDPPPPANSNAPPPAKDDAPPPANITQPPPASDNQPPKSTTIADVTWNKDIQLQPILRGDEQQLDSQVTNEHEFGQMVDRVANEYGLDPAMFRAQLQQESGAFNGPDAWKTAMQFVGDTDRGDNASLGLGQISEYFLNNGPWSKGGPGNDALGDQDVTTSDYESSVVVQLRTAAAIDALRFKDYGVAGGLAYYVNGSTDTSTTKASNYISDILDNMGDSSVQDV